MNINYDKNKMVAEAFNVDKLYFAKLREWHIQHDGLAIEPEMKNLIESQCIKGANILEAGCGEGSIINWFGQRHPETNFTGVDISKIGVEMAQQAALSNVKLLVADLKWLPLKDGFYDFVFSQSVIEHVVNWEVSLGEIAKILQKGGKVLIRVSNGGIHGKRLFWAFFYYIFRLNKVIILDPSLKLDYDNWKATNDSFDVQEIPSDVLMKELKNRGFKIIFFTTRTNQFMEAPFNWQKPFLWPIARLKLWPFSHLGPTIIVLAQKK